MRDPIINGQWVPRSTRGKKYLLSVHERAKKTLIETRLYWTWQKIALSEWQEVTTSVFVLSDVKNLGQLLA